MTTRTEVQMIASVAQLLSIVLVIAALYFARGVFIPLTLGLLLSFLLTPIVNRLQRLGVPNVFAVVTTATLAFLLLAGGLSILGRELSGFVSELPEYRTELLAKAKKLGGLTSGVGGSVDKLAQDVSKAMEDAGDPKTDGRVGNADGSDRSITEPRQSPAQARKANDGSTPRTPLYIQPVDRQLTVATWAATAGTILGPLATAGLVSVFAIFMLIHREDLRDRMIAAVSHGDYVTTTEALDEVGKRISRYLVAQTVMNASYGLVLMVGLYVIGMTMTDEGAFPNAMLWGVLASTLRFIPYIGPTASAVFPLSVSLAMFPGYGVFAATFALIILLELISNNIVEPWLYGTSTGISAVAVIIAAVFWGWLWGPVGLLLSTPLTVSLVVLGRHVKRFSVFTTLLGEDVQTKPSLRFYQRLLANDDRRAKELIEQHFKKNGLDSVCDDVLIPAMKRMQADCDADRLTDEDYFMLMEKIEQIQKEAAWVDLPVESTDESSPVQPPLALVIGCPSHHAGERILLDVMKTDKSEYCLERTDEDESPDEIAHGIATRSPAVAVIMVLPAGGLKQARFLCKTIRAEGYGGPIVVGCLGKFKQFDRIFIRFRKSGATYVTTSFRQTRAKVQSTVSRKAQHGPTPKQISPIQSASKLEPLGIVS